MKTIIGVVVFLLIGLSQANAECPKGMWGPDCKNVCGYCVDNNTLPVECSEHDGRCPSSCQDGYYGSRCNIAICEPKCEKDFECIAPNVCDCGADINKVRPVCQDLRLKGVGGSLLAIVAVTFAILICNLGSKLHKRINKSKDC